MRGKPDSRRGMCFANDFESRVPSGHPLRPMKRMVDAEFRRMSHADCGWFVRVRQYRTSRFERARVRPEGAAEW